MAHLWPVVRVSAGVGPGVELAAVGGVEARHEAVVRQHRVEVLHTTAGVQLLQTLSLCWANDLIIFRFLTSKSRRKGPQYPYPQVCWASQPSTTPTVGPAFCICSYLVYSFIYFLFVNSMSMSNMSNLLSYWTPRLWHPVLRRPPPAGTPRQWLPCPGWCRWCLEWCQPWKLNGSFQWAQKFTILVCLFIQLFVVIVVSMDFMEINADFQILNTTYKILHTDWLRDSWGFGGLWFWKMWKVNKVS